MVRFFTRGLARFCMAVLLLGLGICAVEVGVRGWNLRQKFCGRSATPHLEPLTLPSAASWIDVSPLLDLTRGSDDAATIRIRTNEVGLRGPTVQIPKPRGVLRIVVLGGDTVFGSGVDDEHTVTSRLAEHLKGLTPQPVDIINAGCPDAGPLINLLRYRHHLAALQPDLVVVCLSAPELANDDACRGFLRLDPARQPAYAPHPRTSAQGYELVDSLCSEFLMADLVARSVGEMAGLPRWRTGPSTTTTQHGVAAVAPVVPLNDLVTAGFGRLLVSLAPNAGGLDPDPTNGISRNFALESDVRTVLRKMNLEGQVAVRNSLPEFGTPEDVHQLFSPRTGQLTPQGNDRYAQQLARFVLESLGGTPAAASLTHEVPASNSVPRPLTEGLSTDWHRVPVPTEPAASTSGFPLLR